MSEPEPLGPARLTALRVNNAESQPCAPPVFLWPLALGPSVPQPPGEPQARRRKLEIGSAPWHGAEQGCGMLGPGHSLLLALPVPSLHRSPR